MNSPAGQWSKRSTILSTTTLTVGGAILPLSVSLLSSCLLSKVFRISRFCLSLALFMCCVCVSFPLDMYDSITNCSAQSNRTSVYKTRTLVIWLLLHFGFFSNERERVNKIVWKMFSFAWVRWLKYGKQRQTDSTITDIEMRGREREREKTGF